MTYTITEIETTKQIHGKYWEQYYGELEECIKEFERKYGTLNGRVYWRAKGKRVYIVSDEIGNRKDIIFQRSVIVKK